ncbi:MAG: TonB-dependent receptor [Nannocystaceae bacterium]
MKRAGRRTPVVGARVTVLALSPTGDGVPIATETDEDGRFEFEDVPVGAARVVITAPGYERYDGEITIDRDGSRRTEYYLKQAAFNPYSTLVKTRRADRSLHEHRLERGEFETLPGARGDPLRAVQNLPGMARGPLGLGLLIVRGSSPRDSGVFLGEHRLPRLYHLGGYSSVFQSNLLESIAFTPSNFSSRYGNAIGGIVSAKPRAGTTDSGVHGHGDFSGMDLNARIEAPIGKGSFALAGRRSIVDSIFGLIVRLTGGSGMPMPRYWDYQGLFDYPTANGALSVRVFGSDDRIRFVPRRAGAMVLQDNYAFHRVDLVHRARLGDWKFLLTPSYLRDIHRIEMVHSDFERREHLISDSISMRSEMQRTLGSWGTATVGSDTTFKWWNRAFAASATPDTYDQKGTIATPAVYASLRVRVGVMGVVPQIRYTQFGGAVQPGALDPRLRANWQLTETTRLVAGAGLFSQSPPLSAVTGGFTRSTFAPERASHFSLGISQDLDPGINVGISAYYKHSWDVLWMPRDVLLAPETDLSGQIPKSHSFGRMVGVEWMVRKMLTRRLFGWISYGWSRSERRQHAARPWELHPFDQTHTLSVVGGVKLPRRYRITTRFRFMSGHPYTPCVGHVFNSETGRRDCMPGVANSARLAPYHQLDIRADKTWISRRTTKSLYLDVTNVYNRTNTELMPAFGGTAEPARLGFSIFPTLGFRVNF